jgi:hypothetical protein
MFIVQANQTSQYVVPCGGVFLGKWRSTFAGSSGGKMNVQSACALNTRYYSITNCTFHEKLPDDNPAGSKHVANVHNEMNGNTKKLVIYYEFAVLMVV